MNYDFNPTELLAQQGQLSQEELMAKMLRQQAGPVQMPEGQMVSGHYVAPHWTQQLAAVINPLMGQRQARQAEDKVAQRRTMLQQAVSKAQQEAARSYPQGTPGQPAMPGQPPVQGNNPSAFQPGTPGQPAVAPQLPNAMQRMQWLSKASQVPGFGPTAMGMDKIMGEEVRREDDQDAKRQAQNASLFQRQMELEQRAEDKTLDREQQAQLRRESLANARAIAAMTRGSIDSVRAAGDADKAERLLRDDVEAFSKRADPVNPLLQSGQAIQDMLDSYKEKGIVSIPGLGYQEFLPSPARKAEGNANKQLLDIFTNAMIREQAGLSQTLTESERALVEMMRGTKGFNQKEFEAGWPNLVAKVNAKAQNVIAGHTPEAVERFRKQGGSMQLVKVKDLPPVEETAAKNKAAEKAAKERARLEQLRVRAAGKTEGSW